MTEDRIDQLGAESGIMFGVKAAKEGRVLPPAVVLHVAEQSLDDFVLHGSETEKAAARRWHAAWYEGFARGFRCGVAAMTRAPREETRLQEGEADGQVIPFPRRDRAGR